MNTFRRSVLIMCLGDVRISPRASRFLRFFSSQNYTVSILGYGDQDSSSSIFKNFRIPSKSFFWRIPVIRRLTRHLPSLLLRLSSRLSYLSLKLNNWHLNLTSFKKSLTKSGFDYIVVEDLHLLPFAFEIKKDSKVLFDAREYYTRQFEDNYLWSYAEKPLRLFLCDNYLKKCDHIFTVSQGLSDQYLKDFKVNPSLLLSVPNSFNLKQRCTARKIKLVHHGVLNANRNLYNLIDIFSLLESRFSFDLYLKGSFSSIKKFKKYCSSFNDLNVIDPVPFEFLVPTLNKYDIGFYYLEPNGFNLRHSLPNKLFEYIQARLAVAIGPSPEMMKIVDHYSCGFVSKQFTVESMADTLNSLTPKQIDDAKNMSNLASNELCWEVESKKLLPILSNI